MSKSDIGPMQTKPTLYQHCQKKKILRKDTNLLLGVKCACLLLYVDLMFANYHKLVY